IPALFLLLYMMYLEAPGTLLGLVPLLHLYLDPCFNKKYLSDEVTGPVGFANNGPISS
ncbi:hypothetical protein CCACVL1_20990, partial [Corchorus capsularis]